jgi:hypothetical protein
MYTTNRNELRHAKKARSGALVDPCPLSGKDIKDTPGPWPGHMQENQIPNPIFRTQAKIFKSGQYVHCKKTVVTTPCKSLKTWSENGKQALSRNTVQDCDMDTGEDIRIWLDTEIYPSPDTVQDTGEVILNWTPENWTQDTACPGPQ